MFYVPLLVFKGNLSLLGILSYFQFFSRELTQLRRCGLASLEFGFCDVSGFSPRFPASICERMCHHLRCRPAGCPGCPSEPRESWPGRSVWMEHSRGNFPIPSRDPDLSRKPQKPWGNGRLLKRTMAERNGGIKPSFRALKQPGVETPKQIRGVQWRGRVFH